MDLSTRAVFVLLLALAGTAVAEPVTVTTRSTGTTAPDATIMMALGLKQVPATASLPYALTLTSHFDSDDPWARDHGINEGGEVMVDFLIGGQAYHYKGSATSKVERTSVSVFDSYQHRGWFDISAPDAGFTVQFYNDVYYLPGSSGQAGPLTPFDATEKSGKDVFGHSAVIMYPDNPDVPLRWAMDATVATIAVQVAVVPEPPQVALLAAGLLTLAMRLRASSVRRSAATAHLRQARKAPACILRHASGAVPICRWKLRLR
ncbi:hypothetical protein [Massilia soli]|uniref:PEP-CTERM sorting domain-containing protein n=1 Tax=Massilia soli TaxID=2792854 RepID=A0ABS7SUC4_9BURK|nr:hypothetical protein [Massilia soli]MBZ2209551.1 hypothetical protein [Massilia soli]